jgi:tetratricopeptide (TPR) repeat protein
MVLLILFLGATVGVARAQDTAFQKALQVCRAQTVGANSVSAADKIAACTQLLASDQLTPQGRSEVYVLRSEGYGVTGPFSSQMSDLSAAIKTDPTNADAWAQSCSVHTWTGKQGDHELAVQECTTAIRLAPNSNVPWTFRGDIYLTQHDYRRAISDYDHALQLDSAWMWPWDNRGEAYLRSGNFARAIADFDQVIKVAPDFAMGYLDRGIAEIKERRLDAALSDFETGLKVQPKVVSSLYGRGIVKILKGDRAGGTADIAAAKKADPDVATMFIEDGVTIP